MRRLWSILKWLLLVIFLIGAGALAGIAASQTWQHGVPWNSRYETASPPWNAGPGLDRDSARVDAMNLPTLHVRRGEQRDSIQEPASRVVVEGGQVIGPVSAREVRLEDRAVVNGAVSAEYGVTIVGAQARADVTAREVRIFRDSVQEENRRFGQVRRHFDGPEAEVAGNVKAQHVTNAPGTIISGSVITDGQAELAGVVNGDVTARNVILKATAQIKGNIRSGADTIVMEPGAQVFGRITGPEGQGVRIVAGAVTPEDAAALDRSYGPPLTPRSDNSPQVVVREQGGFAYGIFFWIPVLIGLLALSFIAYSFLREDAEEAADAILLQPLRNIWIGFLTILALGPLVALSAVTIIGIPVAVGLAVTALAAAIVGWTAGSLVVGRRVAMNLGRWQVPGVIGEVLIGAFLLAHLGWVPLIGWLILLAITLMGFGAVVRSWYPRFRDQWRRWRKERKQQREQQDRKESGSAKEDSTAGDEAAREASGDVDEVEVNASAQKE
ncbi:polymer-forming cytoskeletal protein [Heliomicrobium undosum]|nr:polymer-forming cytoskeletal protein [Heliomicrobium undosum]